MAANTVGKISSGKSVADISTFIGESGNLFYDITTGNLRISDGVTPGGLALALSTTTFNAGDFKFVSNTVSMALTNESMNISTSGTGSINLLANTFNVYPPQSGLSGQAVFTMNNSGEIKIVDLNSGSSTPATLSITGNADGTALTPTNFNVQFQITGYPGISARSYIDGNGSYGILSIRRYNGSSASPTQVLATQTIGRVGFVGYATTSAMAALGNARIEVNATDNFTSTTQGTQMSFYVTATGTTTLTQVLNIASTGLLPNIDNTYTLGNASTRWASLSLGNNGLSIQDQTLGTNATLTVNNNQLAVSGATQFTIGGLTLNNTTIESTNGSTDFSIGLVGSTANLLLNRNTVMAAGKTLGLTDTVLGSVATLSVTSGVLLINGAYQLQVGQLKFNQNTIQSTTPSVNIQIGQTSDTANITLNRNLVFGSSGIAITFFDSTTQTTAGVPLTQKAQANGVATLDATGKIPVGQIPSSLSSAIVYKGGWNASTNTPALSSTLPAGVQTGWEYAVTATGTRDIGSGSQTYSQGGFVIYNGSTWDNVAPAAGVTSINTLTGAVTGFVNTSDTGSVTNTMLAGSISNAKLTNSSLTVGTTAISLGASSTTLAGLTSVTSASFVATTSVIYNGSSSGTSILAAPAVAGSGTTITLPSTAGTLIATGDTGTVTNTMLAGSIANAKLTNSSVTVTAGTGMSGGGSVSLGGSVTLTNAGVTGASAGTGITVSASTGSITITNSGVTSNVAGTGITVSSGTGASTIGLAAATTSSLGGVQPDGTTISVSAGVISSTQSTVTTVTTPAAITVSMSGPGMYVYTPSTNANVTVTLGTFTAGRIVRMYITPQVYYQTFNFTGVTTAQNNLNKTTVRCVGPGVNNIIAEIFCTTTAIGGIYINFINAQ